MPNVVTVPRAHDRTVRLQVIRDGTPVQLSAPLEFVVLDFAGDDDANALVTKSTAGGGLVIVGDGSTGEVDVTFAEDDLTAIRIHPWHLDDTSGTDRETLAHGQLRVIGV